MLSLGFSLSPLARAIGVRGRSATATQVLRNLLFGSGQQGVMYVPKPIVDGQQVLFQDSAGTTPVSADGDTVGYMQDLSGNGNHATQSTSAARPIYRTDGTLHWLQFDGVDDKMLRPGITRNALANLSIALENQAAASCIIASEASTSAYMYAYIDESTSTLLMGISTLGNTHRFDGVEKSMTTRDAFHDDLTGAGVFTAAGFFHDSSAFVSEVILLGYGGTGLVFKGGFYGYIEVESETYSPSVPENYLASLRGITL